MLWNWHTIDACFLAESWHIRDNGMFAASCIGVALLVVLLEFMRRLGKEYDASLTRSFHRHAAYLYPSVLTTNSSLNQVTGSAEESCCASAKPNPSVPTRIPSSMPPATMTFRASPLQQLVRSLIHMVIFGLGYIIMLLAMYFNGYIIISIIFGACIGKFLCDWMVVKVPINQRDIGHVEGPRGIEEPTVCCG